MNGLDGTTSNPGTTTKPDETTTKPGSTTTNQKGGDSEIVSTKEEIAYQDFVAKQKATA